VRNITLSLDEKLLAAGREYAKAHKTSLNALIRELLAQAVLPDSEDWVEAMLRQMDQAKGNSCGRKWKREDIYDV